MPAHISPRTLLEPSPVSLALNHLLWLSLNSSAVSLLLDISASTSCCSSLSKTAARISGSSRYLVELLRLWPQRCFSWRSLREARECVPHPCPPRTLTIVAVLLQVLLELVRAETGVLVHPEVRQAFCRALCVCVLHPAPDRQGIGRLTAPIHARLTSLLLVQFSPLVHHPHLRSAAPSNSGVLDWQKERISAYTARVLYHDRGAQDGRNTPLTHASKFQHIGRLGFSGGLGDWGRGLKVGLEVEQWGGEMVD